MKKLLKVLAVAIFAFMPLGISSSASARAVCEIGYTGPDSKNLCKSTEKFACDVDNVNNVKIVNSNKQIVASGKVSNTGNSQGGNATSGTVTNNNGTTFLVTISNPGVGEICMAEAVVPPTEEPETPTTPTTPTTPVTPTNPTTPTNPVQPTAGGGAAGGGEGRVAVLPETSDDFGQTVLVIVTGSLATMAVLGVGGVALYRFYKSM